MNLMVELIVNGQFIGLFETEDSAKEWALDNKPMSSYSIFPLGTTIPCYCSDKIDNHTVWSTYTPTIP